MPEVSSRGPASHPVAPQPAVAVARSAPSYGPADRPVPAPELPGGFARTTAEVAVRELFVNWGLDAARLGTADWNPLAGFIPPGARVLLKPNWVLHYNKSGQGMDCLITHPSVIEAVLRYVALTRPGRVVAGDAPVQGCDFDALRAGGGLDEMADRFRREGAPLEIVDFRRTTLPTESIGHRRHEDLRPLDAYVLFDLKDGSLLEPVSRDAEKFRVTMYNPDLLKRTHAPGRHQYLIARDIIDADVVVNLPKLKSHKKSGITGALKNMVGINGNKEYLPHHRKGGAARGGDCYAGGSWLKGQAEHLLDAANRRTTGSREAALLMRSAEILASCARIFGDNVEVEGAWYGNDTIWRTCLDLQRVLHYGGPEGALRAAQQRTVVTITDAIVGGEGEGPLANTPVPSGFVTGSLSTAAAEWCHARWMGMDPAKVPLVREAFGAFPQPLAPFRPHEIVVLDSRGRRPARTLEPFDGRAFLPPSGWRGHCELRETDDSLREQAVVA